jgi:hypothetical protein
MLRSALQNRVAMTDIVASGFNPMNVNERVSSRVAMTHFRRNEQINAAFLISVVPMAL